MKTCSVECCNNKHYAKGYCKKHYYRTKRYGEPTKRNRSDINEIIEHENYAEIILYDNYGKEKGIAKVDLDDIDKVKDYKWSMSHDYVYNSITNMFLHRLIMNCPKDMVVDHINHNPLDNRKSNLRICTVSQNGMNAKIRNDNTSGVTGVGWDKKYNKWYARIAIKGERILLGYFNTKEEAVKARQEAEIKYFGKYRNQG